MKFLPTLTNLTERQKAHTYHLDLYHTEEEGAGIPVITFVYQEGNTTKNVSDIEDFDIYGSELVRNAFTNLRELEQEWKIQKEGNSTILAIEGEAFATEKILDKDFLNSVHESLNSDKIVVGIPCKGYIYFGKFSDQNAAERIQQHINEKYNDFSQQQVSSHLYVIENGIIKEVISKDIQSDLTKFDITDTDTFSSNVMKMGLYQDIFTVKILISATQSDGMSQYLFQLVQNALIDHGDKKGFNGKISIQGARNQPHKTRESIEAIVAFFDRVRENKNINYLASKSIAPIEISFQFGSDFNSGANDDILLLKL